MDRRYLKLAIAVLLIVVGAVVVNVGAWWWLQRQWFDLQAQQLAAIKRLGEFPPAGWSSSAWRGAVVTPYNVWGSVTYHPDYSRISIDEMRTLASRLDQIAAETTRENGFESVDRVFQLLLQRGWKTEFIAPYREEFQSYRQPRREPAGAADGETPDGGASKGPEMDTDAHRLRKPMGKLVGRRSLTECTTTRTRE